MITQITTQQMAERIKPHIYKIRGIWVVRENGASWYAVSEARTFAARKNGVPLPAMEWTDFKGIHPQGSYSRKDAQ